MAERKAPQRSTVEAAAGDSPQSAKAEDRSRSSAKPPKRRVTKRCGGYTVTVDSPARTTVTGQCSVHGVALVNGECPELHEGRGWRVEKGS